MNILARSLALVSPLLPVIALAHGGVEDGHPEEAIPVAVAHVTTAPELLIPGSINWFALLAVSILITSALSYGVYRYIQVPPVETKKPDATPPEKK